jgi:pSer/pThr/pTyr-binding forkhead associated (FHA) protein
MARLILNCEGVGLVMPELGRDILMIGRSPLNQIVIDHPTVSTQHAVLLRTGASYSLKDLDSRNGTRINGDFCREAGVLRKCASMLPISLHLAYFLLKQVS